MKQSGDTAERVTSNERGPTTYLPPGIAADSVARFFRAAASLHRAAPWSFLSPDSRDLTVTIEALGVKKAPLSLLPGREETQGFVLFPDAATQDAFLAAAVHVLAGGEMGDVPAHSALELVPADGIEPECLAEIAAHGWEVAAPNAHPEAVIINEAGKRGHPTPHQLAVLEAVALAAAAMGQSMETREALRDGEAVDATYDVQTAQGQHRVLLQSKDYDDQDDEKLGTGLPAEDRQLLAGFEVSPEALAVGADGGWAGCLLEHALIERGATAATLSADVVEQVVFDVFPRQVSCETSAAGAIIREVLAFLRYLARVGTITSLDDYLAVFTESAEADLEQALSDPSQFGPAKTFFMAGIAAGHDTSTPEGLSAWLAETNGLLESPRAAAGGWAPPRLSTEQQRAKRNKRKAARKGRRKNR